MNKIPDWLKMKQPKDMSNPELDMAIAVEFMRWHKSEIKHDIFYYDNRGAPMYDSFLWCPTRMEEQMIRVVSKLPKKWALRIILTRTDNSVGMTGCKSDVHISGFRTESLSRAVCEAVLIAKRGEK